MNMTVQTQHPQRHNHACDYAHGTVGELLTLMAGDDEQAVKLASQTVLRQRMA